MKICENERTNVTMEEHIDVDIANGRMTKAEILNFAGSMEILTNGPVM